MQTMLRYRSRASWKKRLGGRYVQVSSWLGCDLEGRGLRAVARHDARFKKFEVIRDE